MTTFNNGSNNKAGRDNHITVDVNYENGAGTQQSIQDFITMLEKLRSEVLQTEKSGRISVEAAKDTEDEIVKVIEQTKRTNLNKGAILARLNTVKALIENATAATGLVHGIAGAIEMIRMLF